MPRRTQTGEPVELSVGGVAGEGRNTGRMFAMALEQLPDAVILTDREGGIEYVNAAFERTTGYDRREVHGLTPRILKSGVQTDQFYRELWDRLFSGRPWSGRIVNRRKNGTTYSAAATVSPIVAGGSEIVGFLGVERDIDARSMLWDPSRRAAELELALIVNGIVHEVRNPLNAMQAALSALDLDLDENEENRTLIRAVRSQVTRIADLMRHLLDFSRPVDDTQVEPCLADALCSEAVALWRARRPEASARQVVILPLGREIFVQAHALRLQQAIANLIDNAVEHSSDDSTITICLSSVDEDLSIEVIDEGKGVAAAHLERVFEPFFTTRRGARGLGLSAVRSTVEQLGGSVTIRNNTAGPGCTVRLKLALCADAEVVEDASETAARR